MERLRLNLTTGTLRLSARVSAPEIPGWYGLDRDELTVGVSGATVFDLSEERAPPAKGRSKGWNQRYRRKGADGFPLSLPLVRGTLRMKARGLERRGDGAVVRYREHRAGLRCITTDNIVSPWYAIAIQRVEGDVSFRGDIALHRCR